MLRKQKGLTQEELADVLYVSRAAVSKWESGRGYPNIDSLKAIAKFFSVSIDELLSGEELLSIAEEDRKQEKTRLLDLSFGLLDLSAAMLFFLPLFRHGTSAGTLLSLHGTAPYLKLVFCALVAAMPLIGAATLALQSCQKAFWLRCKTTLSLCLNTVAVLVFMISLQPYASMLLFAFLTFKGFLLMKLR